MFRRRDRARQGVRVREMFAVRRISYGVGVERTFLVHSPRIEDRGHAPGGSCAGRSSIVFGTLRVRLRIKNGTENER